jgi:methyltransferase
MNLSSLPFRLGLFLAVVVLQRLAEMAISARNARRMKARGARESGSGHFPLIVLVHVLYPLALAVEVLWLGARPGPLWPLWLAFWLAAQALRYSSIRALGEHWNVRILVLPGVPLVHRGPYRWLRHPNYLAVVVELIAGPMIFGAWRTALLISALDGIVLWVRIRAENWALRFLSATPGRRATT